MLERVGSVATWYSDSWSGYHNSPLSIWVASWHQMVTCGRLEHWGPGEWSGVAWPEPCRLPWILSVWCGWCWLPAWSALDWAPAQGWWRSTHIAGSQRGFRGQSQSELAVEHGVPGLLWKHTGAESQRRPDIQAHRSPSLIHVGRRLGPNPDGYGQHLEGTHLSRLVLGDGLCLSGLVTGHLGGRRLGIGCRYIHLGLDGTGRVLVLRQHCFPLVARLQVPWASVPLCWAATVLPLCLEAHPGWQVGDSQRSAQQGTGSTPLLVLLFSSGWASVGSLCPAGSHQSRSHRLGQSAGLLIHQLGHLRASRVSNFWLNPCGWQLSLCFIICVFS